MKLSDIKPHRLIRSGSHPICPRCGWSEFDDWWHVLRDRRGLQPGGKLECGKCDKTFFIEGVPGNLFSTCFGLNETDRLLRSVVTGSRAGRLALRKEAPDADR